MSVSLFNYLLDKEQDQASRSALKTTDGRNLSFSDLRDLSARIAGVLTSNGVRQGDRVAAQVDKSLEAVALYLAVVQIGAIYLPLNTAYTRTELGYFLTDAEPSVFVGEARMLDTLALPNGVTPLSLETDGTGTLMADAASSTPFTGVAAVTGDDVAAILYTSGTTGRPKGAMITHANLIYTARTLQQIWGVTEQDVLLHALPVFHAHGLFIALNVALAAGAATIFLPKFSVDLVVNALPHSTLFMAVPTLYGRLLSDPRLTPELCASMRLFTSGSAPLSPDTHAAFKTRTGHAILERYGMTETAVIASNPLDGVRAPGTVGYVLPGLDFRICDADGALVAASEVGGLEVRGPNVFKGYWRMPDKTAAEFRADGFFMTGDLARADLDGRLTLVSRAKDLIISGGYNVYPREVELVLNGFAGIADSAVVGVPHPDFGEGVIAVVEMLPGTAPVEPAALITYAAQDLASYKLPKRVYTLDTLPRNALGKVLKHQLAATFGQSFQPGAKG